MTTRTFGRFEVIKALGEGATGTVYLCNDPLYGRDTAIKVYDSFAGDSDTEKRKNLRKMFLTERSIADKLVHPNILRIYDTGIENETLFVAMEYVHGARTIAAYGSTQNLLPVKNVIEIISKCAKALNYAHSKGVIHRDIKPDNIMLTIDNDVRVIDFGIAVVEDSDMSMIEGVAGSPAYISPEQITGAELTHSLDLYSLGIVSYRLLTGRLPFRAKTLVDMLDQIVNSSAAGIDMYRDDIPDDLCAIVQKMMSKDIKDRYASGLDIALDLSHVYQSFDAGDDADGGKKFSILRKLSFFRDFAAQEIRELIQIASWDKFSQGNVVNDGSGSKTQYYVVLRGSVSVVVAGRTMYSLAKDNCFGGAGDQANSTAIADADVHILRIGADLLEQTSTHCQLIFNKTFLNALIMRLEASHS